MSSKFRFLSPRGFTVLVSFVLATLVFSHNQQVATESSFRRVNYESWLAITHSDSFFKDVKDRDSFISSTSNDAYEVNAGNFYAQTGIRLAYIFRSDILWPELSSCGKSREGVCRRDNLAGSMSRIRSTLPNLNRDPIAWQRSKLPRDWIDEMLEIDSMSETRVWIFDIFLMTPDTAFVFLSPVLDSTQFPEIAINMSRIATLTTKSTPEFTPSINGKCLVADQSRPSEKIKGMSVQFWLGNTLDVLDYRDLYAGSC